MHAPSTPPDRRSLVAAGRYLLAHPVEIVLERWNWKSSLLSCVFRGLIFFTVNIVAGLDAAVAAMLTEMAYRAIVTGAFASLTQWFRLVEPAWLGALTVMILVPGLNQGLSFLVHWLSGTAELALSLLVSFAVSAVSAWFNFSIMRQGVFIVEPGSASLWRDLATFPSAVANLFRASPRSSIVLFVAAGLLLPETAAAQTRAALTGTIEGTVSAGVSASGSPRRADASDDADAPATRLPNLVVELVAEPTRVIATTVTDDDGAFIFREVPPGRYAIRAQATETGRVESVAVDVEAGGVTPVALTLALTEQVIVASPAVPADNASPAQAVSGRLTERLPVADDVRALLPLLPGVVRGADGRIQMKGGQPTQGDYQVSGASVTDPSTGDFAFALPSGAVESVQVLADPFAAEYGRFTSGVTEIVTRSGGSRWQVTPNSFIPRVALRRDGLWGVNLRSFTPRVVAAGPLVADRLFLAQSAHYRFINTPLTGLDGDPTIGLRSLDSYTRLDTATIGHHQATAALAIFPRTLEHAGLDAFHPYEVTTTVRQRGFNAGLVHRWARGTDAAVESMVNVKKYDASIAAGGNAPMVLTPEGTRGHFFNDQARNTDSVQGRTTFTRAVERNNGRGHLFKAGVDFMWSGYTGRSTSRAIEIRRGDGTLARRIGFGPASRQDVSGKDLALFAQDRWRTSKTLTLELGLRADRDGVTTRIGWSPRAGLAYTPGGTGRTVLRGGAGVFYQRTPLNVGAFTSYEPRTIERFGPDGVTPLPGATTFAHERDALRMPSSVVWNAGFDRQIRPWLVLRVNHLRRTTSHDYIVQQTTGAQGSALRLDSTGRARYWEQEVTLRYLHDQRHDLTVSYVRSRAMADANAFDLFFGNARAPIVLPNEFTLSSIDVPNRLLAWGTIGIGAKWDVLPVFEIRNGFPFSAVDEEQDLVGSRNRAGRFPVMASLDVAIQRGMRIRGHRMRVGLRIFNALNRGNYRDVQTNVDASTYGGLFNPAQRGFGATFWIDP
ncbi:MAG: TonB-dependent receptor [Vicinamibacterales bacterium]